VIPAVKALDLIPEKDFNHTVKSMAEGFGWRVFSTWNSQNSPAGEPDLRMIRWPRMLWVELKTEKGKVSAAQEKVLSELMEFRQIEVYVWRPRDRDGIERILR